MFPAVEVPVLGLDPSINTVRESIDNWISSEAMQAVVAEVGGGVVPLDASLEEKLAYLEQFTSDHWNFRNDNALERNQIDADAIAGSAEEVVLAAATALGMSEPRAPRFDSYDHVVVLGGLVRANVGRSAFAAHLLSTGVSSRDVVGLSGYRPLAPNPTDPEKDEFRLLERFKLPPRDYEWEVLADGLTRAFDSEPFAIEKASPDGTAPDNRWLHARATSSSVELTLVVAPPDGGRRATTPTTYAYWAREVAGLKPTDRVLAVTTTIYVPFQHANAVQHLALPFGCAVDTVGIDQAAVPHAVIPQTFRGAHYALEIRSAVRSYVRLLTAAGN